MRCICLDTIVLLNTFIRLIKHLFSILFLFIGSQVWSQTVIDTVSAEQQPTPPTICFGFDYFPSSLMGETVAPGAESLELQVSEWNFGIAIPNRVNDRSEERR